MLTNFWYGMPSVIVLIFPFIAHFELSRSPDVVAAAAARWLGIEFESLKIIGLLIMAWQFGVVHLSVICLKSLLCRPMAQLIWLAKLILIVVASSFSYCDLPEWFHFFAWDRIKSSFSFRIFSDVTYDVSINYQIIRMRRSLWHRQWNVALTLWIWFLGGLAGWS